MRKTNLTFMLMTLAMLLVVSCGQRTNTTEASSADLVDTEMSESTEAKLAPDFELPDLQGNPRKLSSLRGKYVVLDFWGSWCVWCLRGIPTMKEAYKKHKEKMEILGIDCRDHESKWRAAVNEYQLPWLQVRCPENKLEALASAYGVTGFPTKVVIDPEGKLVKVFVGEDPAFYTFLDELLGQ